MVPTFKPGQVLYVRPKVEPIKPGDVVVYQKGEVYIVHRVNSLQGDGIHTRGDNNSREDEIPISADQIVGVVAEVDDWGNQRPVHGGRTAYWISSLRWFLKGVFRKMLPWLGAPYRWLKARRWVAKVWRPRITLVQMQSPEGRIKKYVVRGKVVATWEPGRSRFTCRRPFDLVIPAPLDHP